MASGFTFGFGGDDLEDIDEDDAVMQRREDAEDKSKLIFQEAEELNIDDMLSCLPSQMEFSTQMIYPADGEPFPVARRQLMDIRLQIMAEQDVLNEREHLLIGLQKEDINPSVYEGGFKTWECALDLANYLSTSFKSEEEDAVQIIELGAGTGMPSLSLFYQYLARQPDSQTGKLRKIHFVLADYNAAVLKLATLPNMLLTWYISRQNRIHGVTEADQDADQLMEIDQTILEHFQRDLSERGITLSFISGAWSPKFVDLCLRQQVRREKEAQAEHQPTSQSQKTIILASETIYSPTSLLPFTETLVSLLRRTNSDKGIGYMRDRYPTQAMISAKKVYFGVGGGINEFQATLNDVLGDGNELRTQKLLDVHDAGVGRIILGIVPEDLTETSIVQ